MEFTRKYNLIAIAIVMYSGSVLALEEMNDAQLGDVSAQARYNFMFEDIKFQGREIGNSEAGSINTIAADGSALLRKNYNFTADAIGTRESPLTTESAAVNATVNTINNGEVTSGGNNLGILNMLMIGLPEKSAWKNVDIHYDAYYENPTEYDNSNRNIIAGGSPTEDHTRFGRVSIDNLSIAGQVGITGIPHNYKIESVYVDDGSQGAGSREGLLLDINIAEIFIEQWLFETEQEDGVFNPERDIAFNNLKISNLQMKSATFEATPDGLRLAYHNPQPFTQDEGLLIKSGGGFPDTEHSAYNPNFPKTDITFNAHVPHSLPNESRIKGLTMDHFVLNIRNN